MAWKKGQSGNPGGRPKEFGDIRDLARLHTAAAIKTLVKALSAKGERTRVAAAEALLDRGWGRPGQTLNIDGHLTHDVRALSDAELAAIVAGAVGGRRDSGAAKDSEQLH